MKTSNNALKNTTNLALKNFDYDLPAERIAQSPCMQRDQSKLMVLNRATGRILHRHFHQIEKYFSPGDLLVVNDSRVMYCRIFGRKPTGGKVEILLLHESGPGLWKGLVRNVGWEEGCEVAIANGKSREALWSAHVHPGGSNGVRDIAFNRPDVQELLEEQGRMPLPPYIKREKVINQSRWDRVRYQTVFADRPGSAAAPTAGLHFSPELLDRLIAAGVKVVPITLHVGYGTFQLIDAQDVSEHKIHSEYFRISRLAARFINEGRARGGKVFAVGTTAVRALEHACDESGNIVAGSGWNDLYVCGDYRFKVVDHLITNFHLPKSSLLVLAASFTGRERILRAYREAIANDYRFYSYGDAMLIL